MTWPEEHADTVNYEERELITKSNVALRLVNGARCDLFGNVYYNGVLITAAVGISDTLKADKAIQIATTAPLTGGGDLSANRTLAINNFTTAVKGTVPPPGSTTGKFLKDDGTWDTPISGGMTDGDKGDITVGSGGTTLSIDSAAVTNGKLADMSANSFKARQTSIGSPQDLSVPTVKSMLAIDQVNNTADTAKPLFTTTVRGLVPPPVTATGKYLKDTGVWDTPAGGAGGSLTDGDKGDIVVSGTGSIWDIKAGIITAAEIADNTVSNGELSDMATSTLKGRVTAGTGDPEDLTGAQAKTILAITKADVGLGSVDNTSDAAAPVSGPQQTALNLKTDKATTISTTLPLTGGGDLSTSRTFAINNFTGTTAGAVPNPVGAAGRFLKDDGTWAYPPVYPRTTAGKGSTTNLTAVITDAETYMRFSGVNQTYTIPPNSAVAFPIGTQLEGMAIGTAMTLVAGVGVTLFKARTLVTVGAASGWTAIKHGTDAWDVHGDFV